MSTVNDLLPLYDIYLRHERQFAESTRAAYRSDLLDLAAAIPGDVDRISLIDLRAYQRDLSLRGLSASTILRKFAGFTTFWRWMRMEGFVTEVLTERIQLPRKTIYVPRWLTEDELRQFVSVPVRKRGCPSWTSRRDELAWLTMAWLGLRRSEILNMKVADVRLGDQVIIVRGIKNRRDRVMPIPTPLQDKFAAWIVGRAANEWVFAGARGGQWKVRALDRAFRTHLVHCGLADKGITPHSLRHTFATILVRNGVHLVDVQMLLGHVDIKSTMIYVHTDATRLRAAVDKHILNQDFEELPAAGR